MPKLVKEIKSNIRLNETEYGPGKEDALEAVLTPEQGERLIERGALVGEWEFKKGVKEKAPSVVIPEELKPLESLGNPALVALVEGGFDTIEKVNGATDEQLAKLPKVSNTTVSKIRQLLTAS
jgi:hypothetical protein